MPVETITLDHTHATKAPLYVQIRNELARQIEVGVLAAGEKLPPARELAQMSGVALRTVTKGIRLLQDEGCVVAMQSRGVFVRPEDDRQENAQVWLFLHPGTLAHPSPTAIRILQGIMETAGQETLDLHAITSLDGLVPSHFDGEQVGFIFFDMHYRDDNFGWAADLALERELPCCVAGQSEPEFASVNPRRARGFESAVDHLAALGHRQIALLNIPANPRERAFMTSRANRLGYHRGLRRNGIPRNPDLYVEADPPDDGCTESTVAAVKRLLAQRPRVTAIMCNNDARALLVLKLLHERGLSVPNDISVIGYDNIKPTEESNPALTTVDPKACERGRASVEYVLAKLAGRRVRDPEVVPTLVVRKSTAPPSGT
jgi:DNA-binding LacI/PurR family transcriptional regulator